MNHQGRSDGGIYRYIYPPKSVMFTCGALTHVLKLQWLVKTYTPTPIKFLATPLWITWLSLAYTVAYVFHQNRHKWCKGQKHDIINFWGQEVKVSRSREAKDRFGGLAEASYSTPLGRVAFLVLLIMFVSCELLWDSLLELRLRLDAIALHTSIHCSLKETHEMHEKIKRI